MAGPNPFDTSVPHSARIWNYWLGGKDNFQADREAGDEFLAVYPGQRDKARACRHFLARAVRYLVGEAGGAAVPRRRHGPADGRQHPRGRPAGRRRSARIVYVDNDPLVLAHARVLLTSSPEGVTSYIDADLHDPEAILDGGRETLDLDQPVALLLIGVLGHVADYDEARSIVRRLLDGLPSGSYLVQCDGTDIEPRLHRRHRAVPRQRRRALQRAHATSRSPATTTGLDLVEPGVVPIHRWRPEPNAFGRPRRLRVGRGRPEALIPCRTRRCSTRCGASSPSGRRPRTG